jgi:hypothetical protein
MSDIKLTSERRGKRGERGHRGEQGPAGPGGPATSLVGPTEGPGAQVADEDIPAGFVIVFTGSVSRARALSMAGTGIRPGVSVVDLDGTPATPADSCHCDETECPFACCGIQCFIEGDFLKCYCMCCQVIDTLGIASAPASKGQVVQYIVAGPLVLDTASWDVSTGGSGGLVPGQIYYLSQTEPGRLTTLYPFTGTATKIGRALNSTTLNVQIESGQTDGYTLLKRPPGSGPYSVVAYGFASGLDLRGRSDASWQLAPTATLPGTPIYKNLVGGSGLTGQQPASALTWLSSHVLGLTTPTPPMAPEPMTDLRKRESFISGGLFELTEAQWNAVWTAADPNRGVGSGLLPGYPYYLSDVPGTFFLIDETGTQPVSSGNWIVKCFVALSSTTALIQISDPRVATGTLNSSTI